MGGPTMTEEQLKQRTKDFAKNIIELCRNLPNNREGRLLGNQVFRSGTSVAANYRAACRSRSKAEFISKLAVVGEEADETLFWLELIKEVKTLETPLLNDLAKESDELVAIVVSSIRTAKKNFGKDVKSKNQNPESGIQQSKL